ncbi:hypothetical protein GCM10027049_00290 [Mucilaginibacter puniceus]
MKEEQDIDKIFRQKLGEPVNQPAYREDDWNALEQLLDGGKKRRGVVYWLPVLSSVAALLLLVLGWWLFKPQTTDDTQKPKKQLAKVQQLKKQQTANTDELVAKNNATEPNVIGIAPLQKGAGNILRVPAQQVPANKGFSRISGVTNGGMPIVITPVIAPDKNALPELMAVKPGLQINTVAKTGKVSVKNIITNDYAKNLAIQRNKVTLTSSLSHPQFALTVMGAPDINGANSFQQSRTGTNVGLLFSIGINKLTLTTGVAYSYKPYNTPFNGFQNNGYTYKSGYNFRANPINVLADCRMLDIPLNIDYQIFNKNQNKLSIGTGLSSYIMLKESYKYEYADPAAVGPHGYSIASPGKYLFGVLNLQATYKRQVNAKVGVSVQPYLKLPLGEVGASQVRLQSAGVAIGLSWNINSLTKP